MNPELPIEQFEVYATGIDHPECVAFDRYGDLWAGGEAGQIYRITPDRKVQLVVNLGSFNAGLAFSPDDELFVCNPALGIVRVAPSGEFSIFASHVGEQKLICPNYGVFDSFGNYYVTDSGNWKKNNGYLIRYGKDAFHRAPDSEKNVSTVPPGNSFGQILAGPIGYTNGLALSADERFLYLVESNTDRVLCFVICDDGSLIGPEVYAENCGRFPDGLALDAEGNLYVSCYASDEIWRIDPEKNKTLFAWDRWAIHLGSPTNMAFGGENFDELYCANLARTTITRAKIGRKGQPLANQKSRKKLKPRPTPL